MNRSFTMAVAAAVLAIGGLACQSSMAQAHDAPKPTGIVGTWLANYDAGTHIGYIQWQKGGTVANLMDFTPKQGNALLGDWKANSDGSLSFSVFGWTYDPKGNARTGYFTKSETDTLAGDTYSGNFHVTYYDLDGTITFEHTGALTAVRATNP